MSDTLLNVSQRIRTLIVDEDPSDYAINDNRMWTLIDKQVQEIATRIGLGQSWITNAFTTADGQSDYAMPAGEYAQVVELKDVPHGRLIRKIDTEAMETSRQTFSNVFIKGFPWWFSLIEDTNQVLTVRLYPQPNGAYQMDALVSTIPTRIAAAADVIPFPRDILAALEMRVAARCVRQMNDAQMRKSLSAGGLGAGSWRAFRAVAGLGDEVVADWMSDSESLIKEGIRRVNQLKRAANLARYDR